MSSRAASPDGMAEDVNEVEEFAEDVNPLTLLSNLEEALRAHLPTLEDSSLITLSENSMSENLQLDISETEAALKSSAKYVMTFMETLASLSQTLVTLVKKVADKLNKEFVVLIPGTRKGTEEEIRKLLLNTEVYKDFAEKAKIMATLGKIAADQIEETMVLLKQVVNVRMEAEQAMATLDEAEKKSALRKKEVQEEKEREEAERKAEEERTKLEEQEEKEREEAERKAEEERKMKEEQEKKEREEAEKKAEEERKRREEERRRDEENRNPGNWPPFVYHVSEEEDATGTGLGCVLRVPPGNIEQKDVTVSVVDQLNSTFSLGDNEELVSNIIHIQCNVIPDSAFPYPPWLAISNCSPRGQSAREVVIRICTDGENWTELPTKDAKLPDSPELCLVEGPLTTLCNMDVCAVSKLKIDQEKVSNWGTKLVSSGDSRVSIIIPEGAVRLNSEVSLQVQPVDNTTIAYVKAQGESMMNLIASSHLVSVGSQGKFQKAVHVCMPSPGSSRRPQSNITVTMGRKITPTQQRPTTSWSRSLEEKETVVLAWKKGQGDWQHASGETLTETRDLVSFNLNISQMPIRLLLLRMKQVDLQSQNVADAACYVEQAIKWKCVNATLRQRSDDMASVHIEVCKSDKTEGRMQTLATWGLDKGPQPSEDFFITEGQVVEVCFRGNVTSSDEKVIKFHYNSNLNTAKRQLFVREVSEFDQHGRDFYRGHAKFLAVDPNRSTCAEPPPINVLTELPITLPKPPKKPVNLNRIPVTITDEGPLTKEYFESLSADLGDEWRQLAENLGVKSARVESIKRQYLESDNNEKVIYDVLLYWYKLTPKNINKRVELLCRALKSTGRVDLSEELRKKNDTFQEQSEMAQEYDKMQKAFKFLKETALVLNEWKFLARELRLSEADIVQIVHKESSSVKEQCYQMLELWRGTNGQKATLKNLARTLKKCKMVAPAEKIQQIR